MARILITSALPYINGVKHLGNLVGSQLPSDAYARYMRLRGHEVLLICATDEHGTPAELAAAKEGEPVAEYCARLWQVQKDRLTEKSGMRSPLRATSGQSSRLELYPRSSGMATR
ncbi:MAG: class I tRNA ligase family protein, partial [Pseudomonadota bacterium]